MDVDELEKAIETAFQAVERPETSLRQFELTDQKGLAGEITPEEWRKAGRARVDSKWQDIPDTEIEECDCLLAHMQADEFRYYLPAYMRYSVNNYQKPIWKTDILGSTVFSLFPSSKDKSLYQYSLSQFSLLNSEQKKVIVAFLRFVAAKADYVQRPDAEKALERYWNRKDDT